MFLWRHFFQRRGFSGPDLEVALKLIIALNFLLIRQDIYAYNFFSFLSINVRKHTH